MKKSEWSDREIEELLRKMPKIQDYRDPRDIYQNLSFKRRKSPSWVLPSIAAAAALFLVLVLGPKLFDGGGRAQLSLDKAGGEKTVEDKSLMRKNETGANKITMSSMDKNSEKRAPELMKSAVYDKEVGNGKVITYWIPDDQVQNLIPVSMIIKDPQNNSWLDLFNEQMERLNEDGWGLTDYYPIKAKFSLDKKNQTLDVNVPSDHPYGQGAANEKFIDILKKDIASNSNLKKVRLFTNGKPGIEFGNYGNIPELTIEPEKNHAFLFYYPNKNESPFLVPTIESFKTIKDALIAMKKDLPDYGLKKSMMFELQEKDLAIRNKTLHVSVKKDSKIKNDQQTLFSYEALLLTAKEFGLEKVVINDAPLKQIGPFHLSEENKVPIAPNLRNIDY